MKWNHVETSGINWKPGGIFHLEPDIDGANPALYKTGAHQGREAAVHLK